ncbi:MAG: hypothetical protein WCI50_11160, partial [Actinomycetes bacterium]
MGAGNRTPTGAPGTDGTDQLKVVSRTVVPGGALATRPDGGGSGGRVVVVVGGTVVVGATVVELG